MGLVGRGLLAWGNGLPRRSAYRCMRSFLARSIRSSVRGKGTIGRRGFRLGFLLRGGLRVCVRIGSPRDHGAGGLRSVLGERGWIRRS